MFSYLLFIGQDKKLEGEASYVLGMAYQKLNQLDTALTVSHSFIHCDFFSVSNVLSSKSLKQNKM